MRMRDLERASGTSRETIRYYIREGLLPEPTRTHRNSATYSQDHLARLLTIRRLKDERFLPLSVIRTLFTGDDAAAWTDSGMLPGIDHLLRTRLDADAERVDAAGLCAARGGDPDHLADAVTAGLVEVAPDGSIGPRDARILTLLIDLARLGFSRERGYAGEGMRRVLEVMRSLAEIDFQEFFQNVAPHVGELEAADMAERGIGIQNQLMAEFYTGALLRLLAERRRIANDNSTGTTAAESGATARD
jgi:DNA-binding transcriptional MerR regulator